MNKIKKIGIVAVLALALTLSISSYAMAGLTLGSASVTSSGLLTLTGVGTGTTSAAAGIGLTADTTSTIVVGGPAQTGAIYIGAPASSAITTVNIATGGATGNVVNIATGAFKAAVTIGNETGTSSVEIDSGTGAINIGNAVAKTITIGNITTTTAVNVNTGTGGSTITTTGTGDFTVASGDDVVINGAGADAAITIGTTAVEHTITIGNETDASSVEIDSGTGAINIGNAVAKTITIGNTTGTTAVNIDAGSGQITATGALRMDSTTTGHDFKIGNFETPGGVSDSFLVTDATNKTALGVYSTVTGGIAGGAVTRGIHSRHLIADGAAQTNDVSSFGAELQLRVKENLGNGQHFGSWNYFEQSETVTLASPGLNGAGTFTVEGSSGLTVASGASLVGLMIDSSVNAGATMTTSDFNAIHIKKSAMAWKNGLYLADSSVSVADIRLSNGETISNVTDDSIIIKSDDTHTKLVLGNAVAEMDTSIILNGEAKDFYIANDDDAEDLIIGVGSAVDTTPAITVYGDTQHIDLEQEVLIKDTLTLSAALVGSSENVSTSNANPGVGVAAVTTVTTQVTTHTDGAAADKITLADGTTGQIKIIALKVDGETTGLEITPDNFASGTDVFLNAVGQTAMFVFDGTNWVLVATNGGVVDGS